MSLESADGPAPLIQPAPLDQFGGIFAENRQAHLAVNLHLFISPSSPLASDVCVVLLLGVTCCGWGRPSSAFAGEASYAIAMHGAPAWPEDFGRLPYANPSAPKGGRLVQGVLAPSDTLNPFIVKGIPPPSIRGYVVESLMARGYDEPFTLYGLIARRVETDAQRS